MSHRATVWAFAQELPALQKLVLIVLADRHNSDTNRCDPSIPRVARDCGMSARSVQNAIAGLQSRGLLTPIRRKEGDVNLPNAYTLHLAASGVLVHVMHQGGAGDAPVVQYMRGEGGAQDAPVVQEMHQGGAGDAPGVVQEMHQGGAPRAPEPVIEPVREPVTEPKSKSAQCSDEHSANASPIGTLPLIDGKQWPFTQAELAEWIEAYPAVDVLQQLREMKQWLTSNPRNRKTPRGVRQFVTNWLAREQDKAPRLGPSPVRSGATVGMFHSPAAVEKPQEYKQPPPTPDPRAQLRAAHLRKITERRELSAEENQFLAHHDAMIAELQAWQGTVALA